MKTAVCFPGQALSPVTDLLRRLKQFAAAGSTVEEGEKFIEQARSPLSERTIQQLGTFIASVASFKVLTDEMDLPVSLLVEHGVGMYAALVAARSMSFHQGLEIVVMAGDLLDEVADRGDFEMASIVGLSREELNLVCSVAAESGEVYLANINSPTHFVLSGHKKALVAACDGAIRRGAIEAKLLGIGTPIHTNILESRGRRLAKQLATVQFQNPAVPIVEHIYGQRIIECNILDLLSQQLFMPVKWTRVMDVVHRKGIDTLIALPPETGLAEVIEANLEDVTVISPGEAGDLEAWLGQLAGLS